MSSSTPATPLPRTMRAWRYSTTVGDIEGKLELHDDVPLPALSPSPSSSSELLVEVLSAGLNPVDYKVAELGLVGRAAVRTPTTPGCDFCGRVVQTASSSGSDFAIGDLVFGRVSPQQYGSCGEYLVAPAKSCARVPDGVAVDEAAAVPVAGLTAYRECHLFFFFFPHPQQGHTDTPTPEAIVPHVKAGDKVFINGGSGGTGTMGIQIAKALGCHVTVTCSPGKADLCRSLGADDIVDYTATDVSRALRAKGRVFALAVDNVGAPADLYKAADDFLLPGARFVQVGASFNLASVRSLASRLLLPSFLGGGSRRFEFLTVHDARPHLEQLGRWIAEKKVRVVIDETYDLEDVPKAFERLKKGRNAGKLVVRVRKQ